MSLRRRDVMRLYCYVLLALEQLGFPLPTHRAVWNAIDPCAQEYESLGAFQRDFRRRRCDLLEMLSAELKVRWLQSEPGVQMGDVLQGLAWDSGCDTQFRLKRPLDVGISILGRKTKRAKTQQVEARISKKISDHAVANTWWDPKSLPSWLTEECYAQRIQPLLRGKKVREIAEAMHASQPYAAFVRSGRRRPHPRHWQALAELVGVPAV